jgi:folate-binding Fe-S cluster repair protein YgfZ
MRSPANDAIIATRRSDRHAVRVTGRHRLRFLHAMTSAGLLKATPGDARFATMSTAPGKHIGQMTLEVAEDHVTLSGAPASVARVLAGLAAHRVADDVRWGPAVARRVLAVDGPTVAALSAVAARVFGLSEPLVAGRFADVGAARLSLWEPVASEVARPLLRLEVGEADGLDAEAVIAEAEAALLAEGAVSGDEASWEQARILSAWPDDARELPEEESTLAAPRLVANVDWQKGCFLGQEAFVMARDRGAAPRRVCAARVAGAPPGPGVGIMRGEETVARVGSAVAEGDAAVLLTVLRRRHAEDPQDLRLEDGRPLTLEG